MLDLSAELLILNQMHFIRKLPWKVAVYVGSALQETLLGFGTELIYVMLTGLKSPLGSFRGL